jgi:hypothetical protein
MFTCCSVELSVFLSRENHNLGANLNCKIIWTGAALIRVKLLSAGLIFLPLINSGTLLCNVNKYSQNLGNNYVYSCAVLSQTYPVNGS